MSKDIKPKETKKNQFVKTKIDKPVKSRKVRHCERSEAIS